MNKFESRQLISKEHENPLILHIRQYYKSLNSAQIDSFLEKADRLDYLVDKDCALVGFSQRLLGLLKHYDKPLTETQIGRIINFINSFQVDGFSAHIMTELIAKTEANMTYNQAQMLLDGHLLKDESESESESELTVLDLFRLPPALAQLIVEHRLSLPKVSDKELPLPLNWITDNSDDEIFLDYFVNQLSTGQLEILIDGLAETKEMIGQLKFSDSLAGLHAVMSAIVDAPQLSPVCIDKLLTIGNDWVRARIIYDEKLLQLVEADDLKQTLDYDAVSDELVTQLIAGKVSVEDDFVGNITAALLLRQNGPQHLINCYPENKLHLFEVLAAQPSRIDSLLLTDDNSFRRRLVKDFTYRHPDKLSESQLQTALEILGSDLNVEWLQVCLPYLSVDNFQWLIENCSVTTMYTIYSIDSIFFKDNLEFLSRLSEEEVINKLLDKFAVEYEKQPVLIWYLMPKLIERYGSAFNHSQINHILQILAKRMFRDHSTAILLLVGVCKNKITSEQVYQIMKLPQGGPVDETLRLSLVEALRGYCGSKLLDRLIEDKAAIVGAIAQLMPGEFTPNQIDILIDRHQDVRYIHKIIDSLGSFLSPEQIDRVKKIITFPRDGNSLDGNFLKTVEQYNYYSNNWQRLLSQLAEVAGGQMSKEQVEEVIYGDDWGDAALDLLRAHPRDLTKDQKKEIVLRWGWRVS